MASLIKDAARRRAWFGGKCRRIFPAVVGTLALGWNTPGAAFADVAADTGLDHVVALSGRGEDGAVAAEARLRDASLDHTVLRASWFAQNFSEGMFLDGILAGELALPAGAVVEPFVSVDDVTDVAVAALLDPAHRGRT